MNKVVLRSVQLLAIIIVMPLIVVLSQQDPYDLGFQMGRFVGNIFPFIIVFYVLVPLFWNKKRYVLFAIAMSLLLFLHITNVRSGFSLRENYLQQAALFIVLSSLAILLRFIRDFFDKQDFENRLEIENLNSELQILKYQNSPHFVFNVLNSIDALIHVKPAKASETISKMAVMMRYMSGLYHQERVLLTKELDYIKDFIDLHAMRLAKGALVNFELVGDATDIEIEPMLFMPFIENVFKHGRFEKDDEAHICFELKKSQVHFHCKNVICNKVLSEGEQSGIGLEILKKRLDLLYKSTYKLKVETNEQHYKVSLLIPLKKN